MFRLCNKTFYRSFCSIIPRWKKLITAEQLQQIKRSRLQKISNSPSNNKKYSRYKCPVCMKPNLLTQTSCNSCDFELAPHDIVDYKDNVFINIINGQDKEHRVLYRNKDFMFIKDKFGISNYHIDAIPTSIIEDIRYINTSHIYLIKDMYNTGIRILSDQLHLDGVRHTYPKDIKEVLISGFNFPVSVEQLHLHMILPPLYHTNSFKYPRWHPYKKVIRDLETLGHVSIQTHETDDQNLTSQHEIQKHYKLFKIK